MHITHFHYGLEGNSSETNFHMKYSFARLQNEKGKIIIPVGANLDEDEEY